MYRSQISQVLKMMEDCENKADYRDLRRLINRYINNLDKWKLTPNDVGADASPAKNHWTTRPWRFDTDFTIETRNAGDKLHDFLVELYGNTPFRINSDGRYKIQLIKKLMEFGGYYDEGTGKTAYVSLLHAKQFVEKYFADWC